MLELTNKSEWKKVDSPFLNSENIPALIEQIKQTWDSDILQELTSEYMYHQGSLYESTFAAFPHLIAICEASHDHSFRFDTLLNLSITLSEFGGDAELNSIFKSSKCKEEVVHEIKQSFKNSLKKLNPIASSLMEHVQEKEEDEKRYFLLALAVANHIYKVSSILWRYSTNEEYECCCPECEEPLILWNEKGRLVLYTEDPVFKKNQKKYPVEPALLQESAFSKTIAAGKNYEWLSYYIHALNIDSMKTTINYLFGKTTCPYCKTGFDIFDNLSE